MVTEEAENEVAHGSDPEEPAAQRARVERPPEAGAERDLTYGGHAPELCRQHAEPVIGRRIDHPLALGLDVRNRDFSASGLVE